VRPQGWLSGRDILDAFVGAVSTTVSLRSIRLSGGRSVEIWVDSAPLERGGCLRVSLDALDQVAMHLEILAVKDQSCALDALPGLLAEAAAMAGRLDVPVECATFDWPFMNDLRRRIVTTFAEIIVARLAIRFRHRIPLPMPAEANFQPLLEASVEGWIAQATAYVIGTGLNPSLPRPFDADATPRVYLTEAIGSFPYEYHHYLRDYSYEVLQLLNSHGFCVITPPEGIDGVGKDPELEELLYASSDVWLSIGTDLTRMRVVGAEVWTEGGCSFTDPRTVRAAEMLHILNRVPVPQYRILDPYDASLSLFFLEKELVQLKSELRSAATRRVQLTEKTRPMLVAARSRLAKQSPQEGFVEPITDRLLHLCTHPLLLGSASLPEIHQLTERLGDAGRELLEAIFYPGRLRGPALEIDPSPRNGRSSRSQPRHARRG
jgi:hypothetical protein